MTAETPTIAELRREALAKLDHAIGLPPPGAEESVDEALRAAVRLRDALIERLRREPGAAAAEDWRTGLERVNVAISLIYGVEYSAIGAHGKPLQDAHPVLREVPPDES